MNRRRPLAWYLGLAGIVVAGFTIAVVLIWIASGQQILVNAFYNSQVDIISDDDYLYWDAISRNAYQMQTVVAPTLLTGAVVAGFALLAVLGVRWERRRRSGQVSDEATAEA